MLPKEGRPWNDIRADMLSFKEADYDWRRGRLPSYIYFRDDELLEVQREAYGLYFIENALGKHRAFPSLQRMEREVIAWSLRLLGGDESCDGIFTSGGTESIVLAVKAARDWAAAEGRFRRPFRALIPETAHPAFNRAGELLGVEVVRLQVQAPECRADLAVTRDAIDERTILLVGSAPQYPNGVFDPITALAALASERRLWMHVDSCVGGFLAPFARMNGHPIPAFDLSVPGVTSISADIHKYGFAAKGASLLLFRPGEYKRFAGFSLDWVKGTYTTESVQGTRPGGSIACAWAVMNYLGEAGYRALAKTTLDTVAKLAAGIEGISGLRVLRPYELSLLSYSSADKGIDINAVGDSLGERGWLVGRTLRPERPLQIAVNPVHEPIVEEYLADLRESVEDVRTRGRRGSFDARSY